MVTSHLSSELHFWVPEGPVDCSIVIIHTIFFLGFLLNTNILRPDLSKIIIHLVVGQSLDNIRCHHLRHLPDVPGEKPGVERLVVPGPVETDEAAHQETHQTGDRTEPHVGHVVQPQVGEAGLAGGLGGGRDGGGVGRGGQPGGGAVLRGARHQRTEPGPVVGPAEVGRQEAEAPPEDEEERTEDAGQSAQSVGERHKHAEREDAQDGTADLIIKAINTCVDISDCLPFQRWRWQRAGPPGRT